MSITLDSRIRQNPEPVATEVDGEVVMMSLAQGNYFAMDPLGSRIWALLAEPTTPAAIIAELSPRYTVDPTVFTRDTLAFLENLNQHQLILSAD